MKMTVTMTDKDGKTRQITFAPEPLTLGKAKAERVNVPLTGLGDWDAEAHIAAFKSAHKRWLNDSLSGVQGVEGKRAAAMSIIKRLAAGDKLADITGRSGAVTAAQYDSPAEKEACENLLAEWRKQAEPLATPTGKRGLVTGDLDRALLAHGEGMDDFFIETESSGVGPKMAAILEYVRESRPELVEAAQAAIDQRAEAAKAAASSDGKLKLL